MPHILLLHLSAGQVREAVALAAHYAQLVFFAHALEILLHTVIEDDWETAGATTRVIDNNLYPADAGAEANGDVEGVLPSVVEFLDHFDEALDVIVNCARKTEMTRWPKLFDIVGNPQVLFEVRVFRFTSKSQC